METTTVLVIEDNKLNMTLLRNLLKLGDYKVLEATDAKTGIRMLHEFKVDLVLMDIQLPDIDGWSATRIIKKDPVLKDIPVIAVTSYAMEEDKQKSGEIGCDAHITKPIDTRSFLETIAQFAKCRS